MGLLRKVLKNIAIALSAVFCIIAIAVINLKIGELIFDNNIGGVVITYASLIIIEAVAVITVIHEIE